MDTGRSLWREFDHNAYKCLRDTSLGLRAFDAPAIARGLVLPAFGPKGGYALFRVDGFSVVGVSARWSFPRDARFRTLDDVDRVREEITVTSAPVDPFRVDDLVNALVAARIPAIPGHGSMGVDGVTYELAFGESLYGAEFHWWLQPPSGWGPLRTFFQGMIQLIDEGITEAGLVDPQDFQY